MPLGVQFKLSMSAEETGVNDFASPVFKAAIEAAITLASGTGADQADICYYDERIVASGANDDIDLYGALTSALGATINMAKLVAIVVINAPRAGAANTTNLRIGGGAAAQITGFLSSDGQNIGPLKPGGVLARIDPPSSGICTITATTADVLRISNSVGAQAVYQIALIGRSA